MQGIKRLLFWAIVMVVGYYGLDYVRVHTSDNVIVYKRFAKALMENNHYSARQASSKELAAEVFARNSERMKPYRGTRVLFTYYDVVRQTMSRDGKASTLVVDQVSRVASGGQTGFWGDREIRVRHTAQLEKEGQLWRVTSFTDSAMP